MITLPNGGGGGARNICESPQGSSGFPTLLESHRGPMSSPSASRAYPHPAPTCLHPFGGQPRSSFCPPCPSSWGQVPPEQLLHWSLQWASGRKGTGPGGTGAELSWAGEGRGLAVTLPGGLLADLPPPWPGSTWQAVPDPEPPPHWHGPQLFGTLSCRLCPSAGQSWGTRRHLLSPLSSPPLFPPRALLLCQCSCTLRIALLGVFSKFANFNKNAF